MFNWLKRLFRRPRLIERYEDLDAIIEAHNALIRKSLDIMRDKSVPPKYVLSRFNAIQDAEEKAIAAYWLNKDKKQDTWYKRPAMQENNSTTNSMIDIAQDNQSREVTITTPTIEDQPTEELAVTPTVETVSPDNSSNTQPLDTPKENVIEIHINK